jgi:hypothetical protein
LTQQQIWINCHWQAIDQENKAGKAKKTKKFEQYHFD